MNEKMRENEMRPAPEAPPGPPGPSSAGRASAPGAPPASMVPPWWAHPPKRHSFVGRLFTGFFVLVFVLSIVMNGYLLLLLGAQLEGAFEKTVLRKGSDDQTIAVYQVSGVIDGKAVGRFAAFHREVLHDKKVKAVVLRVDSPGGGASESDQIATMVKELRREGAKKVVVSMGGMAASGGYYISAPADEIVAEPTTWTGSIGVILMYPILAGTLEKIGAEMVVMKSQHAEGWKDALSAFSKPDPRQRAYLQSLLDDMQEKFEATVKEGRSGKLKPEEVTYRLEGREGRDAEHTETAPFNGKIYLVKEAKKFGLIDEIGYQDHAIHRATALAGLDEPKVVLYQPRKGLLTRMLEAKSGGGISISPEALDRLQTPRILMLWRPE